MSQCEQILDYMKGGNKITPLEALNKFGCLSLAQRIANLKDKGIKIESEIITVQSTGKKAKHVSQYWLAND